MKSGVTGQIYLISLQTIRFGTELHEGVGKARVRERKASGASEGVECTESLAEGEKRSDVGPNLHRNVHNGHFSIVIEYFSSQTRIKIRLFKPKNAIEILMDWANEALLDALWFRLMSLEALTLAIKPSHIVDNYLSLALVCKRLWNHCSWCQSLWVKMKRPYLFHCDRDTVRRTAIHELSVRLLIRQVHDVFAALGIQDVCMAGGYASWQLEREFETEQGHDAYPRVMRGHSIYNPYPKGLVWVPSDIDIFVGSTDYELITDVMGHCYRSFTSNLLDVANPECYVVEFLDASMRSLDDNAVPNENQVREYARRMGHTEDTVQRCVEQRRSKSDAETLKVERMWEWSSSYKEHMLPARVRVSSTSRNRAFKTYEAEVLHAFDFQHCRVASDVCRETYEYKYASAARALNALVHRRLHFSDTSMGSRYLGTMRRINKYQFFGFTFNGDDALTHNCLWSEDWLVRNVELLDDFAAEVCGA